MGYIWMHIHDLWSEAALQVEMILQATALKDGSLRRSGSVITANYCSLRRRAHDQSFINSVS